MRPMRWQPLRALAFAVLSGLTAAPATAAEVDLAALYQPYQALLDEYVVEHRTDGGGLVTAFRYRAALAATDTESVLDQQRAALASFDPAALTDRATANAFWVNAYNFFMVAHILENPEDGAPVDGVKAFGSFFNPYRVFQREVFTVGGQDYSLDQIEKETLLGEAFVERGWKDARVHFAVNCASVGCPPLRAAIYTPAKLDAQLDENVRLALLTNLHLRREGNTLYLSRIFDWYQDDFVAEAGSVRDYLLRFADAGPQAAIEATEEIAYIEYDWSLNSLANTPEIKAQP